MIKKMLSLALALLLVLSVAAVGFSAAQVEVAEEAAGAEDAAEVAADADVAETGDGCILKFDASTVGWSGSTILFYIYDLEAGQELAAWGSKKLAGTAEGDIYSFDASSIGVVDGKQYFVIFNNKETQAETYQLLMDTSCNGDTAYCTGNKIENPVDSNKSSFEAKWKNSSLGPRLAITSIGNVVGETCPSNTTKQEMFETFLTSDGKDGLQNAMTYANGKSQDEIINNVASALGLSDSEKADALAKAGISSGSGSGSGSGDDSKSGSGSDSKSGSGDDSKSGSGSDSKSGSGSGSSGSSSSGSSGSSGSSSSGSSSSSSKSGSASNTQTGQGETVLFIMLGGMVAAAGVIFFMRKKERA